MSNRFLFNAEGTWIIEGTNMGHIQYSWSRCSYDGLSSRIIDLTNHSASTPDFYRLRESAGILRLNLDFGPQPKLLCRPFTISLPLRRNVRLVGWAGRIDWSRRIEGWQERAVSKLELRLVWTSFTFGRGHKEHNTSSRWRR
jgi:hypothetical protein